MENDKKKADKKNDSLKTDPKTLQTPDPQDEMEGPVSSLLQGIAKNAEDNNESKEDADAKKDEAM